ncbi:MAG: hypothetical protein ABSG75_07300 [Syntrophales bacterium]|jgi:hypothetical protein
MIKAPTPDEIEYEDSDDEALPVSGVYGLWLKVTLLSVLHCLKYRTCSGQFIFDRDNIFFDFVCDELGLDPERARQKIKEAIKN